MNGRFQIQGSKNLILPKEINANRFFCYSGTLIGWNLVKSLMLLYGTEWREYSYGLVENKAL